MNLFKKKDDNIDHPDLVLIRRNTLQKKIFLKKIYEEWYSLIIERLPESDKPILEIGSGAGFFKEFAKGKKIITSEILKTTGVDLVFDACKGIPLRDNSLSAIVMTDVLHHLPDSKIFFNESNRLLGRGGKIIMIEPWVTIWSRLVFKNLHEEPFIENTRRWEFLTTGPLSGANIALPWIIFERDYDIFKKEFIDLEVKYKKLLMPFSYLFSGGFSKLTFSPGFFYKTLRKIENILNFFSPEFAMFVLLDVTKI
jgi:SAM-dependent methyltransferase